MDDMGRFSVLSPLTWLPQEDLNFTMEHHTCDFRPTGKQLGRNFVMMDSAQVAFVYFQPTLLTTCMTFPNTLTVVHANQELPHVPWITVVHLKEHS